MSARPLTFARFRRAARNAFRSRGTRLFGWTFVRDYLRIAWITSQRWGATEPGTLSIAGCRIDYFNRSDAVFLVHEIFVNATYFFPSPTPAPRIIDCGANIGMATLFFKSLYPASAVIAVEPARETFELLKANISRNHLRDVTLINAALAEQPGSVAISTPGPGSIAATAGGRPGGSTASVQAITLSSLLDEPADFVKIDVEGAEYGVVRELIASGRIGRVRHMVLEYHEADRRSEELQATLGSLRAAGLRVDQEHHQDGRTGVLRVSVKAPAETGRDRGGRRG
jgi:FkbM family methyltransferase